MDLYRVWFIITILSLPLYVIIIREVDRQLKETGKLTNQEQAMSQSTQQAFLNLISANVLTALEISVLKEFVATGRPLGVDQLYYLTYIDKPFIEQTLKTLLMKNLIEEAGQEGTANYPQWKLPYYFAN